MPKKAKLSLIHRWVRRGITKRAPRSLFRKARPLFALTASYFALAPNRLPALWAEGRYLSRSREGVGTSYKHAGFGQMVLVVERAVHRNSRAGGQNAGPACPGFGSRAPRRHCDGRAQDEDAFRYAYILEEFGRLGRAYQNRVATSARDYRWCDPVARTGEVYTCSGWADDDYIRLPRCARFAGAVDDFKQCGRGTHRNRGQSVLDRMHQRPMCCRSRGCENKSGCR